VADKASTLAQEQALQQESDAVATQLAAAAAAERKNAGSPKSSGTVTPSSSYYIMPVHGWKSSNFGMRFDPIYRRWQLHAGVDIAAPTGTQIHAARAGTVIRAGYDGGYGNYTCVNNGLYKGQGMASCYAHQSRILVHVGQKVSLGQVIGLVGETGAATGPHLHFEVRINGKPVQPLNWLPKCFC
jgi:murein DD-endopeptidase MepM/ murein hydrolase activator NlpD